MKKTLCFYGYLVAILFCSTSIFAQSHEDLLKDTPKEHHGMKGSHRISLGIGHSHLFEGEIVGKNKWAVMPSWNLNYDYWLSDKWAIGLHNDLILETFILEVDENTQIERERPIAIVPVGIFKITDHWSVIGGAGIEVANAENFGLSRLGIEYGWHLPNNWEVGTELVWDRKWDYYDSWGFSLTISKIYSKKHKHKKL